MSGLVNRLGSSITQELLLFNDGSIAIQKLSEGQQCAVNAGNIGCRSG